MSSLCEIHSVLSPVKMTANVPSLDSPIAKRWTSCRSKQFKGWSSSKKGQRVKEHFGAASKRFFPFKALAPSKFLQLENCFVGESPSVYPFPLDRVRCGGVFGSHRERAVQFGLNSSPVLQASFEANQSFPASSKPAHDRIDQTPLVLPFRGDELNSFSFGKGPSTLTSPDSGMNRSVSASDSIAAWANLGIDQQAAAPWSSSSLGVASVHNHNPHKAIITFDAATKQILVVNDTACRLFEFESEELRSLRLFDLFKKYGDGDDDDDDGPEALTETDLEFSGQLVLISGKVVEAVSFSQNVFPVSLWIRRLEAASESVASRCLAIVEPVQRSKTTIVFDGEGIVLDCDEDLATLHGYSSSSEVEGRDVRQLFPALQLPEQCPAPAKRLPKEIRKQRTTGRSKDGASFPVSIYIRSPQFDTGFVATEPEINRCDLNKLIFVGERTSETSVNSNHPLVCEASLFERSNLDDISATFDDTSDSINDRKCAVYTAIVCVFANISGMITLLPDGTIHSANHYFALTLFGYSQNQLVGKNISQLIPFFYDDLEFLDSAMFPLYEDNGSDGEDDYKPLASDDDTASESIEVIANNLTNCLDLSEVTATSVPVTQADVISKSTKLVPSGTDLDNNERNDSNLKKNVEAVTFESDVNGNPQCETKDENVDFKRPASPLPKTFATKGFSYTTSTPFDTPVKTVNKACPRILEGSYFGVGRHQDGSDLAIIYQVRLVEFGENQVLHCLWISRDTDDENDAVTIDDDDGHLSELSTSLFSSRHNAGDESTQSISSMVGDFTGGAFSEKYVTLQKIGKGAFGCVKHSYRISDEVQVVTKFIRKSKVYKDCWVEDAVFKKVVPLEVSLLKTVNHPNIVEVLDVFENEDFFQMVMEKHGCGMDLFEFIERSSNVDEPLASHIFRQVASAVAYLHSLNIVHRDVKDENVILNEHFQVKLIDFGSAAFMTPGRVFSTFCGTVEYCSPEVLQGERYRGPELEMWSLGVTLYTLVFGENPFFDVDETIGGILQPPYEVSSDLMRLISHLLHTFPAKRCNIFELVTDPWLCQAVDIGNYRFEDLVQCTPCDTNSIARKAQGLSF